jgi:hypothetical protein
MSIINVGYYCANDRHICYYRQPLTSSRKQHIMTMTASELDELARKYQQPYKQPKRSSIINIYDQDRREHHQYDGLTFIEKRALDNKQFAEREVREKEIKARGSDHIVASWMAGVFDALGVNSVAELRAVVLDGAQTEIGTTDKGKPIAVLKIQAGWKLTDAESSAILPCIPRPKHTPKVGVKERKFLDVCLWYLRATENDMSWANMPSELGQISASKARMRDWCNSGMFNEVYNNLLKAQGLSPERMKDFRDLADREIIQARATLERTATKALIIDE